jgi:pimeloyl-ACP methyl ester carboxylesterase
MADEIAVEIHGNGDPVVMVHGLGGTSNVFGPQADVLSRYFRVIRPDLPGSGRSVATGALSIESLVETVIGVMDRNGARPAHLVGHSMGTIVCQHLAVKYPDAVRSLALIGPLAAPPEAARPNIRARAAKARGEGMPGIADTIVQGGTSAYTKAAKPEVAACVRELLMRQDPEGYALSCEALADAQPAAVESLSIPTLLLTGTEDGTSPAASVRELANRIRGSRMVVFNACGHWTPLEAANQVTESLVNFHFDSAR